MGTALVAAKDQHRLGSVQCLCLVRSSTDTMTAPPGGSRYRPMISAALPANAGPFDSLKRPDRCGFTFSSRRRSGQRSRETLMPSRRLRRSADVGASQCEMPDFGGRVILLGLALTLLRLALQRQHLVFTLLRRFFSANPRAQVSESQEPRASRTTRAYFLHALPWVTHVLYIFTDYRW